MSEGNHWMPQLHFEGDLSPCPARVYRQTWLEKIGWHQKICTNCEELCGCHYLFHGRLQQTWFVKF